MRPQPGELIQGKYRVVQLIADGGMGAIYEARHEVLGTAVALKLLHPDLARRQALVQRFLQEARVSATLKSPHIVQVLDIIQEPQGAVLVMELLQGEPLQRLIDRQRRLPQALAIDIALQMLSALEVAHAGGVVHRDLKPDNVFLVGSSAEPQVKLLDFGIAKLRTTQEFQRGLTRPGVVMGTPEYMAPEQAFSADTVDARADIYALGVMLFEMLAGQRPVGGDEPRAIAQRVFAGQVRALSAVDSSIPMGLVAAVHRAMAPTPAGRFGSAVEMRQALLPFAGPRRTPTHQGSATPPPTAPATLPQPSQPGVPSALAKGPPASIPGLPSMLAPPAPSPTGPGAAPAGHLPPAAPESPPGRSFSPGTTAPLSGAYPQAISPAPVPYSPSTGAMAGWPQNAPTAPSAQPSLGPPGSMRQPPQAAAQAAGPMSHQGAGPMNQQGQGPGQPPNGQGGQPRPTSGVPRTLPPGSDDPSNTTMPRDPLPQAFTPTPNPWTPAGPSGLSGPPPTVGGSDQGGMAPYTPPGQAPSTGVYTSAGYPNQNAMGGGYTAVGGPPVGGGGGYTAIGQAPQMTAVGQTYQAPVPEPGYGPPPTNQGNSGAYLPAMPAPGRSGRRGGVPVGVVAALAGLAGGLLVVLILVLRGQDSPAPTPVPIAPTPSVTAAPTPTPTPTMPGTIPTIPTTPVVTAPTATHTATAGPRPGQHLPDAGLPGGADGGAGLPIPGFGGIPGMPSAIPTSITIPMPF
jgi:serine/threonine-protein kinase